MPLESAIFVGCVVAAYAVFAAALAYAHHVTVTEPDRRKAAG